MIQRVIVAVVVWRIVRRLVIAAIAFAIAVTLLHGLATQAGHQRRHHNDPVVHALPRPINYGAEHTIKGTVG